MEKMLEKARRTDMIENTDQLIQAIEQMGRMQRVLESFRRDILPKNAKNFALFAEGPVDEIGKLQDEIDDYITRLEETPERGGAAVPRGG
jgi:hypothetical protein